MSYGLEQKGGSLMTPMALAHPLRPFNSSSRKKRRNLWVARCVSSWWPLLPSLCVNMYIHIYTHIYIYIYVYICIYIYIYIYMRVWILKTSSVIGHIYIHKEYRSMSVKLHPINPITVNRTVLGSARFLCWMPPYVFHGLPIVSWSILNSLILGLLRLRYLFQTTFGH